MFSSTSSSFPPGGVAKEPARRYVAFMRTGDQGESPDGLRDRSLSATVAETEKWKRNGFPFSGNPIDVRLGFAACEDYTGLTVRKSFFQPVPTAVTETPMTYYTKEFLNC